jgi:hypothetical protein
MRLAELALYAFIGVVGAVAAILHIPRWVTILGAVAIFLVLQPWVSRLQFLMRFERWASRLRFPFGSRKAANVQRSGRSMGVEVAFGISLAFCALALAMARDDWRKAVVTFALFGGGALVALGVILRKRRERRFQAVQVQVAGGVDIPVAKGRLVAIAVYLAVAGLILFALGTAYPWFFRGLRLFIAICGIALLAGLLLGLLGRQTIRFEPCGLVFGERAYRFCIPWDDIRGIQAFEQHDNPYVGLSLADAHRVEIEPASQRAAFLKVIARTRLRTGADIVIAAARFALDVPPLMAALHRYVTEPAARDELKTPAGAVLPISGPPAAD